MAKMDTVTYELKQGNKVVYVGTTNDPNRRLQEHRDAGKKFTKMTITSRKMSEAGAQKKNPNDWQPIVKTMEVPARGTIGILMGKGD